MHDRAAQPPSPWWYRNRAVLIGVAYGLGFFLGYLSLDGRPVLPAFVTWGRPWGDLGVNLLAWTGVALTLVAWLLRASGTAYLRREVVFSADALQDRLIVAGPFRYVRNPLYLGNLFLAAGIGLFAPPLGLAIIFLGNLAIAIALAREESRQLEARYGATYAAYRAAVPALFPRFTPATVPGSTVVSPSIRSAMIGEGGCLMMAVSLVPLAVFGSAGLPAFWAIWVVSIALFFGVNRVKGRSSGTTP
jgi:protein-S-isoprenylcysteine O-methyltransferase Ste14